MFFLVIVFGLFHGLIVLPIMLSLVGPKAYSHYEEKPKILGEEPKLSLHDVAKESEKSSDLVKTVI